MSISVALDELRAAIADTDRAPYLLTVSDDGRAHTVAVAPWWDDDELVIRVGRHTVANAQARALVSLLWAPKERVGYSLIVDADVTGTASDDDGTHSIRLRPTRAVLHRPAPGLADGEYDPDCVTVPID